MPAEQVSLTIIPASPASALAREMHRIWDIVSILTGRQLYTRAQASSNAIYLTFDDGPDPEHTPKLLDTLARHEIRATFFLQGDRIERDGNIVSDLVLRGHALGNHSYSHVAFSDISIKQQIQELDCTDALLQGFDGRRRHVFRPPYGRLNMRTIILCMRRGQPIALWTHDSLDYRSDAASVTARLQSVKLRAGDILLFHDDGGAATAALEKLLPEWRGAGLEFGTL